jgi:hypothetical protein
MERLAIHPNCVFSKSWNGWSAFLGNGRSKPRSPQEWRTVAESLAAQNGGKLQTSTWLENNGFVGLTKAIRRHRDLFKGIEQESRTGSNRTIDQWVKVAEEISRNNGYVLPSRGWLCRNKFSRLCNVMRMNPQKFLHVRQEFFNRRGKFIGYRGGDQAADSQVA